MAIPNTIGAHRYPYSNSPERTMVQFFASGSTNAALRIIPTNTAAYGMKFHITKLNVGVTNASAGASMVVKLMGDTVLGVPGTVNNQSVIDFYPTYLQSQSYATATSTPILCLASGATVGMYCFVQGFWK